MQLLTAMPAAVVSKIVGESHDKLWRMLERYVDQARREEVKTEPLLRKARFVLLKNEKNLTEKQRGHRAVLEQKGFRLKSYRAMRMREYFPDNSNNGSSEDDSESVAGRIELDQGLVQAAKAKARGYRTLWNLKIVAYLVTAKLNFSKLNPVIVT